VSEPVPIWPSPEVAHRVANLPLRAALLVALVALVTQLTLPSLCHGQAVDPDRAWENRASTLHGRLAAPDNAEAAVQGYRTACRDGDGAGGIEACWKFLRALHFLIDFTGCSDERKGQAIDEAVRASQTLLERADTLHSAAPDRARLFFWSAILWGARGQRVGLLKIVREGVANRMYQYTQEAIELDPTLERGGAYRLLSRLHAELPRVPLISGWVDRSQTLPLAEKAHATDPGDPGNQLILALARLDQEPQSEPAVKLLREVLQKEPRSNLRAEDLAIHAEAKKQLELLQEKGVTPP
jgi:hypothetical protein